MADSASFLRKVPLFADLPASDLDQICSQAEELSLPAREILFVEGSLGQKAYIIEDGQVEIYKTSNGQEVQLAVRQPGEVIGEMALIEASPRIASGRALTDCLLIAISYEQLDHLLNTSPSAARVMLQSMTSRLRSTEVLLRQSEKMAQLGTFTAGIAHELNNPSAAVQRAVEQLNAALADFQRASAKMMSLDLSPDQLETVRKLNPQARPEGTASAALSPLARADQEAALEEWLDTHGIEDAWKLAPVLVGLGYDPERLAPLASGFSADSLPPLLQWLAASSSVDHLLSEIGVSAGRMSEIIKALKTYVYLDQGPVQEVDIHAGLENTLIILRHKLKEGIEIQRQFDPRLPHVQAYGSELNQVWTNVLDNAIDALEGSGRIILRTSYAEPWVSVEFEDNGPGIPPDLQSRLFSPFFTTKPVGKGTGLGLNISYNIVHKHGGDIKVFSKPGETRFQVQLPLSIDQPQPGAAIHETDPQNQIG